MSADPVGRRLRGFPGVGLVDYDARAALRRRVDRKYLVATDVALEVLDGLAHTHAVLRVAGLATFGYRTQYLDTPDLVCLRGHLQGRRRRYKLRLRTYAPSGAAFVELKSKGRRGVTVKDRAPREHDAGAPTSADLAFLAARLSERYGMPLPARLQESLVVGYARSSLVALDLPERITVDRALSFTRDGVDVGTLRAGWVVIESKSIDGRTRLDRELRARGALPVAQFSKYVLGMALASQCRSPLRARRSALAAGHGRPR